MSKSKFAEAEAALAGAAAQTRCGVCNWLNGPDTDQVDAQFMRSLMAQPTAVKGHAHISRVFAAGGVKISADTIARHRVDHQARP